MGHGTTRMIGMALLALAPLMLVSSISSTAAAATCCHVPTVWTFQNRDTRPVTLECKLEKSSAWSGKKDLVVNTPSIAPGKSFKHTWDRGWYADGMGMIPGQWVCRATESQKAAPLAFSTDWGENITVAWTGSKAAIARADSR